MPALTKIPNAPESDDHLVKASCAGDRAAFTEIVDRHKNLVTAIAYSALGDRHASEDVAQETFITAWRSLAQLREPGKLRPWLASIARNVARNRARSGISDALSGADSLEAIEKNPAGEKSPATDAILREEEALVWSSLARLPEEYREPLVLFYREHQSIEHVAAALELSEDAVKQRLSRGRKMLQERVLARIEGTLRVGVPGAAFTIAVVAALPAFVPASAAAATVTATSAALSVGVSSALVGASLGATLGWAGAIVGTLCGLLGGFLGTRASLKQAQSPAERAFVLRGAAFFAAYASVYVLAMCLLTPRFRVLAEAGGVWLPATMLSVLTVGYTSGLLVAIVRFNRRFAEIRRTSTA